MEERMGWREAIGVAIGNLTGVNNDSNSVRVMRVVFLLIFLGGTVWAVYNYLKAQALLEEKYYQAQAGPSLDADRQRLELMQEQVKQASEIRNSSSRMVDYMIDMSRYIFGDPTQVSITSSGGTTIELPSVEIPEVVIEMPPEIVVRAIMVMGKQQVAVMDIAGVGSGMVVKVGDTFMQKKGRIVRIAPDKVVVRWAGRTWDIAPGF